jgi:hypothetical protein
MGLFDKIFRRSKRPIACVYAGPEYFEKMRGKKNDEGKMKRVYAGPEMMRRRNRDNDDTDTKSGQDRNDPVIEDVYNGPEMPEDIDAGLEAVYNGPEEAPEDFIDEAEYPANHAEDEDAADEEEYPANHAEETKDSVMNEPPIKGVYAGPYMIPNSAFVTAYAGPVVNPAPMMMVYAGPTMNPSNGGFMFPNGMNPTPNGNNTVPGTNAPAEPAELEEGEWVCFCGNKNTGKFCIECGAPRSSAVKQAGWTCDCGTYNTGKFCSNCGKAHGKGFPEGTYLA